MDVLVTWNSSGTLSGRTMRGFKLNLNYFKHDSEGVDMTWEDGSPTIGRIFSEKFVDTFGPAREVGQSLTAVHEDIAASLQARLEEVGFHLLNQLHQQTKTDRLCLAGGVAYNSVMNGKILLNTPFREVFVQPAAGDSGTAVGVCYYIHNVVLQRPRSFVMEHALTGPEFANGRIEGVVRGSNFDWRELSDKPAHTGSSPGYRRWKDCRLVPGQDGVWAAGSRQS